MTLTPEERQRIYEEEKARLEAQEHLKAEARMRRGWAFGCLGVLGVLGVVYVLWLIGSASTTSTERPRPDAVAPTEDAGPQLALISSNGVVSEGGGYIEIEGMVKNISAEPIANLFAVAELYGREDRFISSDDALVEYSPLLPKQSTPFKVMVRNNPEMKTYRLQFKDAQGRMIPHEDRRSKTGK